MINNKESTKLFNKFNYKILKHLRKYYNVVNNDNINELRNDIFLNLYKNYNNLPSDINEINKYVYITCKNHVISYTRKIKKDSFIEYTNDDSIIENLNIENNNIENDYIYSDYYEYKISKMDRINQDIINYKNMGYSLVEISELTNTPKTNIYRIFNKIKKNNDNI